MPQVFLLCGKNWETEAFSGVTVKRDHRQSQQERMIQRGNGCASERKTHTFFPVLGEKWELRLGGRGKGSKGGVEGLDSLCPVQVDYAAVREVKCFGLRLV